MEVISDMEPVTVVDFQRLVHMVRYAKNAKTVLEMMAKNSLTTPQMVQKDRFQIRALVMMMFVEVYIADDLDDCAEKFLQDRLFDKAYTESPNLISYKAVLTLIRAARISGMKKKGSLDIMKDIIRHPMRFYDIVVDLGTPYERSSHASGENNSASTSTSTSTPSCFQFFIHEIGTYESLIE